MSQVQRGLKRTARGMVKAASAVADLLVPPGDGVVILIYHQVGAPGSGAVNLTLEAFDEQMTWLAKTFPPISLDRAIEVLDNPGTAVGSKAAERPAVVVTFDDGTADFVDNALPILVRHKIPATLFLATRWVDQGQSFWGDGTILSWAGVKEAVSTGLVDIGSHTHSHVLLDRLDPSEIDAELDRSIELIGEHVGYSPRHFAYPKALKPSPAAEAAVRARFESASLAGTRPNSFESTDRFRLARSPIQVADGQTWFRRKARGGLGFEDRLRQHLVAIRYRGDQR